MKTTGEKTRLMKGKSGLSGQGTNVRWLIAVAVLILHCSISAHGFANIDSLLRVAQTGGKAADWNNVAAYYYDKRNAAELKLVVEKGYELAIVENNIRETGRSWIFRGELAYQDGNFEKFLEANHKALSFLNQTDCYAGQEEALNNIATYYGEQGDLDSLQLWTNHAIQINRKYNGSKKQLGAEYQNLSYAYSLRGKMDSCLWYARGALDALVEAKDTARMLDTYNQLGCLYVKKREYPEALKYFEEALRIYDLVDDKKNRLYIWINLAAMYANWGKDDKALEFSQKAVDAGHEEKITYAKLLSTHGLYLFRNQRFDESVVTIRKCLPFVKDSPYYFGNSCLTMANNFLALNMVDSAEHYLNVVDKLTEKKLFARGDQFYIAKANVLSKLQRYREAVYYAEEFIKIDAQKNLKESNPGTYNLLSGIFEKGAHDYQRALEYKKTAYALQDSLNQQKSNEELNRFYARFQTSEKELEITKLNLQQEQMKNEKANIILWLVIIVVLFVVASLYNIIIRLRKEKEKLAYDRQLEEKECRYNALASEVEMRQIRYYLNGLEAERIRLAGELHDNVSNALVGVEIKLKTSGASPEELSGMLHDIHSQVRNISHALMPPVFQHASLPEILYDYVYMQNELNGPHFDFAIDSDGDWDDLPQETALEIHRIIQEACGNALKHAQASNIDISLNKTDGHIELTITDDGRGMDSAVKKTGLGLQIIRDRAMKMNGTAEIISVPGKGTIVKVVVPEPVSIT